MADTPLTAQRIADIRQGQPTDWLPKPWTIHEVEGDDDTPGTWQVLHDKTVIATLPDWAGNLALWMAGAPEDIRDLLSDNDRLRELVTEHDPSAVPVSSPPPDQTALRDRIAAAIWERQNPGRRWADCEYRWRADAEADADAVLAELPPTADRAAVLHEAADRMSRKAAALTEGLDDLAIFVGKARAVESEILNREATELRRLAAEAQAHPPIHAWRVETRDPDANQWTPGSHFAHRPKAVERWETANRTAPLWNNGTPVERRIVRETTTYTVDTEHAEAQQPDTAPRPVQHAPGKAVLCPNCLAKGYAICMPDETLPPPQGPEYTPCECGHIEPEHEADMGVCLTCDCDGYRPTPPAPLRPSEDDCPGFPERCPNLRSVDPNPPQHYGGIRCGCSDPQLPTHKGGNADQPQNSGRV